MAEEKAFRMPDVEPGRQVLWYPDGLPTTVPLAAFVTAVAHRSVCLSVMHQANHNLLIKDGVRYCTDPEIRESERAEAGTWDFTARDKSIDALLRELQSPRPAQPKK